ncbi:MAG: ABC transporter permease subunit [Beijerinckiaceae bacterium]|nr:ABC transporter permease subunit [Beijerinckiaceae bacterium]
MRTDRRARIAALAPLLWLAAFFVLPFLMVLRMSLSDTAQAVPPYAPHWIGFGQIREFLAGLDVEAFRLLWEDSLYLNAFLTAIRIAGTATLIALLIGFPLAYAITRAPKSWQNLLVLLVILPFWTSFLIRVYAWIAILRPEGVLDRVLITIGLTSEPLRLLNTETAVLIGMVYSYLPFMVLPIYAVLEKMDRSLIEAAADLGAKPLTRFLTITIPLAKPGILAGCFLVFVPGIGEFVIPDLLGGSETLMIGRVLWTEFFSNRDWPLASAVAVSLLAFVILPMMLLRGFAGRKETAR